jgi:cell division protein FtsL
VTPGTRSRPRLTGRAAVLAVVICAVALSLAYPVREYIAQRRQIDQLAAEHQMQTAQISKLEAEQQRLTDPSYVEDQARARLGLCMPHETCYVVIDGRPGGGQQQQPSAATHNPWYATLWKSVQQADGQK